MEKQITACFTGHRHIPPEKIPSVNLSLSRAIASAYANGYRVFLCGGALGFDTLAARQVIAFRQDHPDVRLEIIIPCPSQSARWSLSDQAAYQEILSLADHFQVLSPFYYEGCMLSRNRYMVSHSSLCICYLVKMSGGTWSTVREALAQDLTILKLAMPSGDTMELKEPPWNCIFTFPFAR